VEEYSDWEIGQTSPGEEHQFIGGRFNLDKVGSYSISIELLMEGAAAPVAVARIGNELGVGVSV